MKETLITIAANLVSLSLVSWSGYLLLHDKTGWGWFLFGAIICAASVKFGKSSEEPEGEEDSKTKT